MEGKDLLRIFVAAALSVALVGAIVSAMLKLQDGIIGTVISYKTERLVDYPSILILPVDMARFARRENKTITEQYEELANQQQLVNQMRLRDQGFEERELQLDSGHLRAKYMTNFVASTTLVKYHVVDPAFAVPPSMGVRLKVRLNLTELGRTRDVLFKLFETGQQTMSYNRKVDFLLRSVQCTMP